MTGSPISIRARLLAGPLIPMLVLLLAHGAGLGGEFVMDDIPDIVEHPIVGGDAPLTDVLEYSYLGSEIGEGANTIRPLSTLLFAIEWSIWGESPLLFHLMSLLAFAGLVFAAQVLFRRFTSEVVAMAGAALFASLAIHVDAVGLIANRAEVLSLLLAVLAFHAALKRRPVLAVFAYLAALLAKESAILLPFIVLWHAWVYDGGASLSPRRRGREVLALVAAGAVFLVARASILDLDVSGNIISPDNMLMGASIGERIWMPFVLLGKYLTTTLSPTYLSFDYSYSAIPVGVNLASAHAWLGITFTAAMLGASAWLWRLRKETPAARLFLFAGGAFFVSYALFSNSVFLIVTIFAERLFLAPSLWLVLLALSAASALKQQRALAVAATALIAVQVPMAALRTIECRDQLSLLQAQVESQPASVKGHAYLSKHLARTGRPAEALWHLALASAGTAAHKRGAWRFPEELAALPLEERLHRLPELLAPETPPERFWPPFRGYVAEHLGEPGVLVIEESEDESELTGTHVVVIDLA